MQMHHMISMISTHDTPTSKGHDPLANMSKYVQDSVMSGFSPLTELSQEQGTLESHRGSRFYL